MKSIYLKFFSLIAIVGVVAIIGMNSQVYAQRQQREVKPPSQNNAGRHQEQYQQQKVQNQQRYEQRQQSYQNFHQQRVQQPQQLPNQPQMPSQNQNRQQRVPNQPQKATVQPSQNKQSLPYSQRPLNNGELKQWQSQRDNWDKSERNWQSRYDSQWKNNQDNFNKASQRLQQQKRTAQYNFQQAYWERVREDRSRLQNWQFYNDVALNYSYLRNGKYFYVSEYGVNMLNDAVNDGYQEGYLAGQADREDNYKYSFQSPFAYQDAAFGYNGYWVDLGEYQYYFRKGFQDGYDDGFYNRYQYGAFTNGNYVIQSNILRGLIDFSFIGR